MTKLFFLPQGFPQYLKSHCPFHKSNNLPFLTLHTGRLSHLHYAPTSSSPKAKLVFCLFSFPPDVRWSLMKSQCLTLSITSSSSAERLGRLSRLTLSLHKYAALLCFPFMVSVLIADGNFSLYQITARFVSCNVYSLL